MRLGYPATVLARMLNQIYCDDDRPVIIESWRNCIGPNGLYHKHEIERYVYRKDKTKITVTARTSVLDCLPVDAEMPLAVTG